MITLKDLAELCNSDLVDSMKDSHVLIKDKDGKAKKIKTIEIYPDYTIEEPHMIFSLVLED